MDRRSCVEAFVEFLVREEKSAATRKQYRREAERFLAFVGPDEPTRADEPTASQEAAEGNEPLGTDGLTRGIVLTYKERLMEQFAPVSVNAKLAAVNRFLKFIGREELSVRLLKIQRKAFCVKEKVLEKEEYMRLVRTARQRNDRRLELILETICGTGIRISELSYITAEAVERGEALILLKGKTRVILLPGKLRNLLRTYARRAAIRTGAIFVTRSGHSLDRSNVWKMMKSLCEQAGVDRTKVFPHNLRHLFARCFYEKSRDIAKLADILGHSSINTTRIYLRTTGAEHRKWMDQLGLVTT